jgi:hypothetical protein
MTTINPDLADTALVFDVEIWGTVASWVAIGATGVAAALAAWYYVNDKSLEAKAQARQIRILIKQTTPEFVAVLFNNSEHRIHDVAAEHRSLSLTELLVYRGASLVDESTGQARPPRRDQFASLRQQLSAGDPRAQGYLSENDGTVTAGADLEVKCTAPELPGRQYSVVFRDRMSRRWRLVYWTGNVDGGTGTCTHLSRARSRPAPGRGWHLVRHPYRFRWFIRRWLEVRYWEKRNPSERQATTSPETDNEPAPAEPDEGGV